MAEKELQHMRQAIYFSVDAIQRAEQQNQLPSLNFTHTAIDPLIVALQGKTLSYVQPPFIQQNNAGNALANPNSSRSTTEHAP